MYKFAREGIDIERKARNITIHQLELNGFDGREFKLTVTCSKGTYIRNLVEDIGERLGVGAHVTRLHRCYTAGLANEPMYGLDELAACSQDQLMQYLLPIDRAIDDIPKFILNDDAVYAIRQGKTVKVLESMNATGSVRLYDHGHQFIGLGVWDDDMPGVLKAKRLLGTG